MPEFDVKVEGRRRQPRWPGPFSLLLMLLRRVLARPFVLIPAGLILFVWLVGTPHVAGPYTCNGPKRSGGGCEFSYESCTYYGVQGRRLLFPEDREQCQLFRLMPVTWGGEGKGEFSGLVRVPSERAADAYPLNESRTLPLYWGVIAGTCGLENFPSPRQACNRLLELMTAEGEYPVVECIYGPINRDGTGWRFYHFWNNKVPQEMGSLATPGEEHPFKILGKNVATECPSDSRAANELFQSGRISGRN